MQQLDLLRPADAGETPAFLQEQLITYIGNKRSLLPFIGEAVRKVQRSLGAEKLRILDLFSGTGIVARYLKQFSDALFVNDLETYSRVTSECYLSNASSVDRSRLVESLAGRASGESYCKVPQKSGRVKFWGCPLIR